MGVYIKGMEMPTSCMLCPFCVEEADPANGEMCMVTGTLMPPCTRERLENCPLIPVPPHGDLIDRDALINDMANMIPWAIESPEEIAMVDGLSAGYEAVKDAPTIIPAEEGE
jgi:hypothetical protein